MSIEVNNVHAAYYGDVDILHGVTMCAQKSKVTAIIGPNGAGKSTLLKTIFGFLKPRKGTITFDGEDITGAASFSLTLKGLRYIPQRRCIFPYLTVYENLRLGAWAAKIDKKEIKESINRIYEKFPSLKAREKVAAGRLSGGEQRMLEFGRALITSPKAILVDEPTAGLAPKVAKEIYQKLEGLKEEGIGIVLVDQNVRSALLLSDYVCVLKMGRIELEGPKGEFDKRMASLIREWLV